MKQIGCPVCSAPLAVRAAQGRRSHKPFIMLVCAKDPRHFRGFITHQDYVLGILEKQKEIPAMTNKRKTKNATP